MRIIIPHTEKRKRKRKHAILLFRKMSKVCTDNYPLKVCVAPSDKGNVPLPLWLVWSQTVAPWTTRGEGRGGEYPPITEPILYPVIGYNSSPSKRSKSLIALLLLLLLLLFRVSLLLTPVESLSAAASSRRTALAISARPTGVRNVLRRAAAALSWVYHQTRVQWSDRPLRNIGRAL